MTAVILIRSFCIPKSVPHYRSDFWTWYSHSMHVLGRLWHEAFTLSNTLVIAQNVKWIIKSIYYKVSTRSLFLSSSLALSFSLGWTKMHHKCNKYNRCKVTQCFVKVGMSHIIMRATNPLNWCHDKNQNTETIFTAPFEKWLQERNKPKRNYATKNNLHLMRIGLKKMQHTNSF